MGIRGAAVGTVIAQMLVLVISVIVLRKKTKIHIYLEKGIIFETIRIGITAFGISLAPTITLILPIFNVLDMVETWQLPVMQLSHILFSLFNIC